MKNSAFENFSEEALSALDFARCQRPDGSFYGTSGTCRKGSPAGAKEKRDPSKDLKNKRGQVIGTSPRNMMLDNRAKFEKRLKDARSDQERELLKKTIADIDKKLAADKPGKASGNTRATSATPKGSMTAADKKRAEKAAAGRKVAAEMKPKVKELDRRAKDLNKEANRLEKAFRAQAKKTEKNPTKENKERLKLIQRETRMADRAAKKADKAADKAAAQMEKALRKAMR